MSLGVSGLSVWLPGGVPVLEAVSLEIAAGEMLALVGESGAGKTTLTRAICGMLPEGAQVEGRVECDRVAPIFQVPRAGLSPVRRVGKQIADALRLAGRGPEDVEELLRELGLGPQVAGLYPDALSGGMAQRVAIARALATGAGVITADEPTAALDGPATRQVLAALARVRDAGRAVLLVTHDPVAASAVADRIAVLHRGRVIEQGPARRMVSAPRHPLARAQIAAAPARLPAFSPPPGSGAPLLTIERLDRRLPGGAGLHGVSLHLARGEVLAVTGVSGSGKTTLARALARLDPVAGSIRFLGEEIGGISPARFARDPRRRLIQMVFQEAGASFPPGWSPLQTIARAQEFLGSHMAIPEAGDLAGLDPALLGCPSGQLSQGQLARAALVRAIAMAPDILILDEPTAALDATTQAGVLRSLDGLRRRGMALILIAHDLHLARLLADRLLVLEAGRVVETGATGDLLSNPSHPATRALVAAMVDLAPRPA